MNVDRGKSNFGLTASGRGWYKRITGGGTKWIASFNAAPTARDADRIFAERFGELTAPPTRDAVTLDYGVNAFIDAKRPTVNPHTLKEYQSILKDFKDTVGERKVLTVIGPVEFTAYAKRVSGYSVIRRTKIVGVIRTAFNWFVAQEWMERVSYGPVFAQPSKKLVRIDRAKRPRRMYTAKQVRTLYRHAKGMMRAAVLLGINGGMGPADVSRVTVSMIDGDLLRADREKTGATRIVPLWPITQKALTRLTPDDEGHLFYGSRGGPLESLHNRGVVRRFQKLCDSADVPNLGFYTLRRTFRTVADAIPDRRAVDIVTGHVQEDMGSVYVQEVHPDRLRAVTDHVLKWFSGRAADASNAKA